MIAAGGPSLIAVALVRKHSSRQDIILPNLLALQDQEVDE